jgi:hypothetical protein
MWFKGKMENGRLASCATRAGDPRLAFLSGDNRVDFQPLSSGRSGRKSWYSELLKLHGQIVYDPELEALVQWIEQNDIAS